MEKSIEFKNKCKDKMCCHNCTHQLRLMKHPMNKGFGEGSISEQCGYVCIVVYEDESNKGEALYFNNQHGMCELYDLKTL
ncbi:hypothetical protein LCGC14_1696430 [marine sediment metagenome]|uniref:Uncharacterized protein n=1 Tax=marine sediment metagenome TaxID=412755 RepID=A0A0F9I6W6_9ZZZZ